MIEFLDISDNILFQNIADASPIEKIEFLQKFTHHINEIQFDSFESSPYNLKMLYGEMNQIKYGNHCVLFKYEMQRVNIMRSFKMKSVAIDSQDGDYSLLFLIPYVDTEDELEWVADRLLECNNSSVGSRNIVNDILMEQRVAKRFKIVIPEFDDLYSDDNGINYFMSFNSNGIYGYEKDFEELPVLRHYNPNEMDLILDRPFISIIFKNDTKEIVMSSVLYEPHNPFKSKKQRAWMHINKPRMARKWERKYHGGGKRKRKLPKRRKRRSKRRRKVAKKRTKRRMRRGRGKHRGRSKKRRRKR